MLRIPGSATRLEARLYPDVLVTASTRALSGPLAGRTSMQSRQLASAKPEWRPAVDALGRWLAGETRGRREIGVVVSDLWGRYCLVPRQAGITRGAELQAYARHAFRAEYGAAVDDWKVAVDVDGFGTATACLMEASLHDAITRTCAAAGVRLASLTTHFCATQARLARRVRGGAAWFAVLEVGHLAAAFHDGHTWRHLVNTRLCGGAAADGDTIVAALAAQSLGMPQARAVRTLHLAAPALALGGLRFPAAWTVNALADPFAGRPAGVAAVA